MRDVDERRKAELEAVKKLMDNAAELGNLVTARLKSEAREAIDDSIQSAKDKAAEFFSVDELRAQIQSHPKAAVATALVAGAFIGMGRSNPMLAPMSVLMGIGYRVFRNSATATVQNYISKNLSAINPSNTIH